MPTSNYRHVSLIVEKIVESRPTSILDVGAGFGKWGCLAREYVDGWCNQRYLPSEWCTIVHGVEIFEGYRSRLWDVYDTMVVGDVTKLIDKPTWALPQTGYDLVIMIDVLEHISKPEALPLLEKLKLISKKIILSYSNCEQTGVCANSHEDHISKWSPDEFPGWNVISSDDLSVVLVWAK